MKVVDGHLLAWKGVYGVLWNKRRGLQNSTRGLMLCVGEECTLVQSLWTAVWPEASGAQPARESLHRCHKHDFTLSLYGEVIIDLTFVFLFIYFLIFP